MRGLERLKLRDDGGSFDRLVKKSEELAIGNKSSPEDILTRLVLDNLKAKKRKKSMPVKEKESNFANPYIRIPKKIRSKRSRPASRIESSNKSITERCCLGVVEEEGQTVKKPAVKKQSKADRLNKKPKKLMPVKEKGSNFDNPYIRIPKKIRSKRSRHASRIESGNKSITERCCLGVVEEEGQTVKKPAVKKQSKADRLNKKRKADSCLEEKDGKKRRRTTIMKDNLDDQLGLNPPPDLPQKFKDRIKRMNGTNVTLVTQKKLTRSDMNDNLARFSIPNGQVRSHKFLTDEEKFKLNQKEYDGISCSLIQPCLEEIRDLKFKKWDMNKTFIYSLKKKWKSVANRSENQLAEGSEIQLWSFRVDLQLWFAMNKT